MPPCPAMKTTLVATTLLGAAALIGCVEEPNLGTTAGISFEDFRTQAAKTRDGTYIVDWDIELKDDEALRLYWEQTRPPQGALALSTMGGADNKWSDTQKLELTYCISNTGPAGFTDPVEYEKVKTSMEAATDRGWEMFADINFVHKPDQDATCNNTNMNVLFDVSREMGQMYLARAFFPPPGDMGAGRAQANVLIDQSAFQEPWPLQNILGHELGHVLGFRHEHVRPEANAGDCGEVDNDFKPLTPYDSASIMHYPQCNGTSQDLAFTAIDKMGAEVAYGKPIPNLPPMTMINKPSNGATVPPTFAIEASVVDEDTAKVDLYIDNVFYASLPAGPFNFQAMALTVGPHELKIVGTDKRNQTGMQVINVTVEEDSGCCSAGGSPAGAGLLAGLTFLGLFIQRRRRS